MAEGKEFKQTLEGFLKLVEQFKKDMEAQGISVKVSISLKVGTSVVEEEPEEP